jgi:hypothetical protein
MKDLVVLVPDINAKSGIEALLGRYRSLNVREFSFNIFVHPERDPGVYHKSCDILIRLKDDYKYALVFIDFEGSGQEQRSVDDIYNNIKSSIENCGWRNRVEVIVFNPELEIWLWVDSPHTAKALGWDSYERLKNYLISEDLWDLGRNKPYRPKEALEDVLRISRIPRSSSIYQEIASKVTLKNCSDPTFDRFKKILIRWFPKVDGK